MKQLMSIFAGIGLTLAGLTAVPAVADAQPGRHGYRDHGPRAHHDDRRWDDRRWNDRRHRDDRRAWNDRRGYDGRRGYDDRRRWDERRRWDARRDRYGYRGERVVPGWSREAAAMGVDYRGPCHYVIRGGRRVCD
ncbi:MULTISPECIES: hypothetical protein [unclassified Sphingomonas]|uniref:hypothetical protein n=1 Tax=unclassified Sphingomonas TaxID=196159 RepID=UPI0006F3803B|nr:MULTISPECIES: hypothetical protein [unclassified Sphingomonas]KQM66871.1 hypothetical protein ASE65_02005 [Sphingomonas sp. Leaf16]KQN17819.1 hypothetical protein ASE81_01385 [Sphingomonas sp. Leaf29]KQN23682.1 hypothetical protein ASE83_04265 [Sphingomonas sp. Leaf32]